MRLFDSTVYPLGVWEGPRAFAAGTQAEADARFAEMRACGIDVLFLFAELRDPDWLTRTLTAAVRTGVRLIADLSAVWRDEAARCAVLDSVKDSPAVIAVNIVDEPPRAWFPELADAVRAVKAYLPGRDVFVNLNPSYAPPPYLGEADGEGDTPYRAYLRDFCAQVPVDCLSFDFYPYVGSPEAEERYRVELLRNLRDVKEAADAAGLPWAGFLQSSRWGKYEDAQAADGAPVRVWRGTRIPNAVEYRFLAGMHLAFGAGMLTDFLYWSRSGTRPDQRVPGVFDGIMAENGEKNPIWDTVGRVGREIRAVTPPIRGMKHIGVLSCGLTEEETAILAPAASPWGSLSAPEGRFLAGCFASPDGRRALLVINADDSTPDARQPVTIRTDAAAALYASDGTTTPLPAGDVTLTLSHGESAVVLL